jgi:16S rRNA (guanine1207-N2)-methyltransferase
MKHYFIDDGEKHDLAYIDYEFRGTKFRLATHAGVFSKDHVDYATDILLNAIPPLSGSLLDLGCGYGVIGIVIARAYGVALTQADVNPAAAELTRRNCAANRVESQVVVSDCFADVRGVYDTIVINPPIHAGKAVTYKMYEQSYKHLTCGGRLYIVTLKKHGAESTVGKLREVFGGENVEVIYRKKGHLVIECVCP